MDIETPRGRPLGKGLALFVDVPWGMASHFLALSALRSQSLRDCRVEHFVIDGTKGRPAKDAAFIVADGWIADNMEDVSAQEYLTGQEADGDEELQADGVHQQGEQDPTVTQLLARVAELEQQAAVAKHLQEQGVEWSLLFLENQLELRLCLEAQVKLCHKMLGRRFND